jgi:diguanylate cyclase (GGDEF)-like protein
MLVEDDHNVMMVTKHYIESFGHEVIAAADGETAVKLFDPATIDLILMDFILPGMDGSEATRQLRETYPDEWFPVIFITAATEDEHLAKGLDAGGDDYLFKPVSPIVLESKLKAMARIVKMQKDIIAVSKQMEQLSYLDGLTHIFNRRGFDRAVTSEWKRMLRDKNTLTFMMIDLDFFKNYNDHYGHQAGDDCLIKVAAALEGELYRPADIVARYGGEEFAVLLPGTESIGALQVAERFVEAVRAMKIPHADSAVSDCVTVSVGVATSDDKTNNSMEKLIKSADAALYEAKTGGRNRYKAAASP